MTKFDTITCTEVLYAMEFSRQTEEMTWPWQKSKVYLHPKSIAFKDETLYQLFKEYLQKSTIESMREGYAKKGDQLMSFSATFNDKEKSMEMLPSFGEENVIGKFFLETGLDWPEYYQTNMEGYNPKYKQVTMSSDDMMYGKGIARILLGRQGEAIIPDNIMANMRNYKSPQMTIVSSSFSYDENKIVFSKNNGTCVYLNVTNENFHKWFEELERQKKVTFEKLSIFKVDDNTVAINNGPGTSGIQIKKQASNYLICNNITADNSGAEDVRRKNLTDYLGHLNRIVTAFSAHEQRRQFEIRRPGRPLQA